MALSFADSVKANCQKVLEHINKKCYSITWQLFTSIVHATPVMKGELINSWYPRTGKEFSSEKTSVHDRRGSGSLSRINSIMNGNAFLGKDGIITMVNNESYAYRAEMLGWPSPEWSGKVGPYRMVALSVQKVAAQNK
jgi:hypothetical protein